MTTEIDNPPMSMKVVLDGGQYDVLVVTDNLSGRASARVRRADFLAAVESECGVRIVPADIAEALGSLARVTSGQDEVLERLEQALMIAQMGGVTNEVLGVLLHLSAARMMTPTVAQRLRDVGIDPDPMDAIVIRRDDLPGVEPREDGQVLIRDLAFSPDDWAAVAARSHASRFLALAEYLDAHPPVDEAQVEALTALLDENPAQERRTEVIARRLWLAGVRPPEATP